MQPRLEVADIFRNGASQFLRQYGRHHSPNQHRALGAVIHCRTAQLGGKAQHCLDCGHQRIQYHSCRNRHCPKCQGQARVDGEVPAAKASEINLPKKATASQ